MTKETYVKKHQLKKAADSHQAKIEARGGKVKRQKVGKEIKLTYTFPDSVVKKTTKKRRGR